MNIYIQNKEMCFENNPEIIEQIFKNINEHLEKENLQFSHLIIDGQEIYDNFDRYIIENIDNIHKIEVAVMSVAQMIIESLKSAEHYVKNSTPIISNLAEEFYHKPNENAWSQLTDLFGGIQWIIQSLTQIDSIEVIDEILGDYKIWDEYVQEVSKINGVIFDLENAVLNKDNVLIGDMLLYEIVPVFEAMTKKLDLLISEAVDKDVN